MTIDWMAVGREAHQLERDHGSRAHLYAADQAVDAHKKSLGENEEFWNAVAASLRPRKTASRPED